MIETEFITFTKMINVGRKEISRIEMDDNGTKRSISKIYAYVGDNDSNYTGLRATFKEIHIPSNATGYDSGDWKSILQDKVGFTVYNDL